MARWSSGAKNNAGQTNVPPGLSNVRAISAGVQHTLALLSDGSVVCWGSQTNVPPFLQNVVSVAAGKAPNFSVALIATGPLPSGVTMAEPMLRESKFTLTIPTSKSRVYQLQHKDFVGDSQWTPLPPVLGLGAPLTLTDPSATQNQRFYQVRQW
jgi:hypothetical protein